MPVIENRTSKVKIQFISNFSLIKSNKQTKNPVLVFKSKDFVYFEHWPDSSVDETGAMKLKLQVPSQKRCSGSRAQWTL